ncbi:Cerato-ulmin hydrophobin family [Xylariaceae sp. AK1471]|nr:Cerato-ulmin hydrophobin family [Xylariaceae sp. AK1471]
MQFSALFTALLATGVAASPVAIDLIDRGYSTTPVYPTTTTTTVAYPTTTTTTKPPPTTTTTTTVYPTTPTTTKPTTTTTTTTTTKSTTTSVVYPTSSTTTTTSVVYPTTPITTTVTYPTSTYTTAPPTSTGGSGGGYFACPNGLFSVPQCCATDILGLADLDCHSPPAVPSSASNFQSICATGGDRARCCVIPVLGQAVLCISPAGL